MLIVFSHIDHHGCISRNVPTFFRGLYLFSEPNNYCFDQVAQGKLLKCNQRNTVTALRTLVKFHKSLKETG